MVMANFSNIHQNWEIFIQILQEEANNGYACWNVETRTSLDKLNNRETFLCWKSTQISGQNLPLSKLCKDIKG